jgi:hypothetical protein
VSGVLFVHRRPVAVYSVFTKLCCWQEWLCAGAREQNAYFFDYNLCENALQQFGKGGTLVPLRGLNPPDGCPTFETLEAMNKPGRLVFLQA